LPNVCLASDWSRRVGKNVMNDFFILINWMIDFINLMYIRINK